MPQLARPTRNTHSVLSQHTSSESVEKRCSVLRVLLASELTERSRVIRMFVLTGPIAIC